MPYSHQLIINTRGLRDSIYDLAWNNYVTHEYEKLLHSKALMHTVMDEVINSDNFEDALSDALINAKGHSFVDLVHEVAMELAQYRCEQNAATFYPEDWL